MSLDQQNKSFVRRSMLALNRRVSPASLAVFRIGFGLIMVWYLVKLIWPSPGGRTKLAFQYLEPEWHCSFVGFEWIQPWPEPFLTIHVWVLILAAIGLALGCLYRVCAAVFCVGYTCLFLWESSDYNNHYYLICLFAFLLITVPANRMWAVDAWLRTKRYATSQRSASKEIPFWPVFLIRFQLFVVYFFGGIAKINSDWLTGLPLYSPASSIHTTFEASGWMPGFIDIQIIALFLAWTGLFFDLVIAFMMMHRRTRLVGFLGLFIFHFSNNFLFTIGIFPLLAFTSTLIFFPADWPLRVLRWLRRPTWCHRFLLGLGTGDSAPPIESRQQPARLIQCFVIAWIVFQVAFPLRHFFIVDDANWTEEGQRFAWRMMLRMKAPGHIVYYVRDDQLMVQSENRVEVDWERWPNEKKNEIYVPILSSHFSWEQHPGLTMIFEPCLGQRIIFGVEGDLELAKQTIRDKWQSTYGRVPTIETTIDLDTAIRQMRQSVAIENTVVRDLLDELERLTVDGPPQPIALTESRRQLDLTDTIERLLRSGEPSAERLRAVHPFEIQGAVRPNRTLLAIRDPLLENADGTGETHRLTDGSAFVVWLDLEKMRPRDWRRLPQQFVVFERGGLNIIWNHFKQLNWQQTERMANRPHMIWQYARHIADCWESSTGRRPEVRADTQVILNYRAPRPIVDPTSDLSRVEYRLLGHNEWITKIEGELPSWNRMRAAAKQTDSNIR